MAKLVASSAAGSLDDVSHGKPDTREPGLGLRPRFVSRLRPEKDRSLDRLEDVSDGGVVADDRDVSTRRR